MRLRGGDRGVALQVGAAILLAFVVLAISAYQVGVVPQQNEQVEFNHNQRVQGQLLEVRNAIVSAPGGDFGGSVSVTLGTTFPERTIFVNPPPPVGQLRTSPPANLTLANATAQGELGDFWDGDPRNFSTRALLYRPSYRVYDSAPVTVYENTVLVNKPPRSAKNLSQSDQRLVRGRTITLVALNGSYQEAGLGTVSVDVETLSSSTRSIAVTDVGGPVTITVPTTMGNETWKRLLRSEYDENGGFVVAHQVVGQSGRYDLLEITLAEGVTYDLRMAKVGLRTGVSDPGPAYLTEVSGDGETISTGENLTLVAEVRDRFNNPVSGVVVNASVVSGSGSVTPRDTSDSEGQTEFLFNSSSTGISKVNVTFSTSPGQQETVTFSVTVGSSGGGGGGAGPPVMSSATTRDTDGDGTVDEVLVDMNESIDDSTSTLDTSAFRLSSGSLTGVSTGSTTDDDRVLLSVSGLSGGATPDVTMETGSAGVDVNDSDGNTLTTDQTITAMDGVKPVISSFQATNPSGSTIEVSFDTTEPLADIAVPIDDSGGTTVTTLTESNFSCSGGTCTATYTVGSDDTYTATLTKARDPAGNDGATGQTDSVTVSTGAGNGPPGVTGASISNAPINDSETGTAQTVTVTFNQSMDTSVAPTVEVTGLASSPYTVSGSWSDATTWTGSVTLSDDDEDATATIRVSGAQDVDGNTQDPNPDTSNTFLVDTLNPQDPSSTTVSPDPINASTQTGVSVDVTFPSQPESGTVELRLTGPGGNTVTATASADTGSTTTTVSGIDVSSLADGTVTVEARILDGVGNANPSGFTAASTATKDTVAPAISNFQATNPTGLEVEVSFDTSESLADVAVPINDSSGTTVTTLTEGDFSCSGGTCTATYAAGSNGKYTAALTKAEDAAGNDGTTGQNDTVVAGALPPTLPATITYVDANGGDQGALQSYDVSSGASTTYPTSDQIKGIGPAEADFDDDGLLEVPYVRNSDKAIVLVDENGNTEPIVTDVQARQQSISVGDVDADDDPEVVFVSSSNVLRQADLGDNGQSTSLTDAGGNAVSAARIAGVEDFNADGDVDVVFLGTNNGDIKYLDDGTVTDTNVNIDGPAIGQPADFDADGDLDVPYVTDNGNVEYVDANGNTATVSVSTTPTGAPMATITDKSGNGVPEIAYVGDNNGKLRWVDPVSGSVSTINERADTNFGVA